MNKKVNFKQVFRSYPEPLQWHIAMHGLFFILFVLLSMILYGYSRDLYVLIPPVLIGLFSLGRGFYLFFRIAKSGYHVAEGICLSTENTWLRKRTKSVVIDVGGKYKVKLLLKQRRNKILEGTPIRIFLLPETLLYEKDGYQMLYEYLALEFTPPPDTGEKTDDAIDADKAQ